ncbi:AraC family transcriptional regulator [Archangium minus]|uniref:AraC family transcriptional regulator n=1 Tax=Archangium minus TaxID=83450 RepID=A0ABY9X950_9BACT|nr:AraC family transcriptional regulator [Archangium minus]
MVDESSGPSAVDPLGSILERIRIRGSVFGAAELGAPWGVQTPGLGDLTCYVLIRGVAHLELLDSPREQVSLSSGDIVLVAAGRALALKDTRHSVAVPFERLRLAAHQASGVLRWGGTGPRTTLVCGRLEFDETGRELFGSALPALLHLPAEAGGAGLLGVLSALASEVATPQPGSGPVLGRLAELLFIHALRVCIGRGTAEAGWLRGLGHPSIARALAAVHQEPGAPWTVESLAARASMSRSTFAAEFHRTVGEPPLAYVTAWRMRHAARLLEQGGVSIKDIAASVGYGSDEAFSRAFKSWSGHPPGEYRRRFE